MRTKIIPILAILLLLGTSVIIPTSQADADDDSIFPDIDDPTGSADSFIEKMLDIFRILDGQGYSIAFTDSFDDNRELVKQIVEEAAEKIGIELTPEEIRDITNYFGVIPLTLLTTTRLESINDINIHEGQVIVAVEIPDYLISMFKESKDPVELSGYGEAGIVMSMNTEMDVAASEDIGRIGMFLSGILTALSGSLGNYGDIAKNFIVTDNFDALQTRPLAIYKGAEYHLKAASDLAVYMSLKTDTNYDTDDSETKYANFNISLHIRGGITNDLQKINDVDAPNSIKTEFKFNAIDLDFVLGFSDLNPTSSPNITVGVNKLKLDVVYSSEVDGEVQKCTIKNSNILSLANGMKVTLKDSEALSNVPITNYNPGTDRPRSDDMIRIVDTARTEATVDQQFDPTNQYIIGGILATIGAVLIIAVAVVRKY